MRKSSKPILEYLNDFLDWLDIEKGLSSKTQENYARFLRKFFNWLKKEGFENLKPHQLTPEHIWKYRVFLSRRCFSKKRRPLKKSTQNCYLIALRSFLNYFALRDIFSLPPEKVKLPKKKEERQVFFLTLQEIEKLLLAPDISTPSGLRDRAILETLFSTGMRVSELVSLNRDQIKIKKETKDLEISIVGKGERPRTVYLSERAVNWLRKYLETRNDKEKALFINYRRKRGTPERLTVRSIQRRIKKYAIESGLSLSITPHVLRHSFATDLLSHGVDLRTVQEFLGHKTITATQIYTHVTHKRLREMHRKFHGGKDLKA